MISKVSIVRCASYDAMAVQKKVRMAIDFIGGMSNFIKPKSKVLIKPNLLMAKEPKFGITTHPEVIRGVIKILKELDCKIFVGDSPSVLFDPATNVNAVYECSGVKKICEEENVTLVRFDKGRWRDKFPLTNWLDESDHLISIPKFKTHEYMLLTGAIKNLYGLIPGIYKTKLHKIFSKKEDFSKILVDIYKETRPALTIIDGITAMEGDGPATNGKLRNLNLLLAGIDCVALDSVMAMIIGVRPLDIFTTKEAVERGLGIANIDSISVLGEKLEEVINQPFLLPIASRKNKIKLPFIEIIRKFSQCNPYVEHNNCIKCGMCIQVCPKKTIAMKNEKIIFDYSKCIACFCCLEFCPASAIKIRKNLLANLIGT